EVTEGSRIGMEEGGANELCGKRGTAVVVGPTVLRIGDTVLVAGPTVLATEATVLAKGAKLVGMEGRVVGGVEVTLGAAGAATIRRLGCFLCLFGVTVPGFIRRAFSASTLFFPLSENFKIPLLSRVGSLDGCITAIDDPTRATPRTTSSSTTSHASPAEVVMRTSHHIMTERKIKDHTRERAKGQRSHTREQRSKVIQEITKDHRSQTQS
ncbi:hypothetical protein PFISCL1PPCAC_8900, partial [Pristionchus fissidentatus]